MVWSDLKEQLKKTFSPVIDEVQIANLLANLKQKTGESINAFYGRLVKTIDKKNKHFTAQEKQEATYQTHFKHDLFTFMAANLRPEFRDRIINIPNPPTTIDDLLKHSLALETELTSNTTSTIQIATEAMEEDAKPKEEPEDDLTKQVAALTAKLEAMKKSGNKQKFRNPNNPKLACWYCHETGHLKKNCPKLNRRNWGNRGGRGQGPPRGRGGYSYPRGYPRPPTPYPHFNYNTGSVHALEGWENQLYPDPNINMDNLGQTATLTMEEGNAERVL